MNTEAFPPHALATRDAGFIDSDTLEAAAALLRCTVAEIAAVLEVEAGGEPFTADGLVLRRFEPHHFPREHWPALGFKPGSREPWRASLALSTKRREAMFAKAVEIDQEAAYDATSWGAPQIMGFNALEAGFASAGEMVAAFVTGARAQIEAFARLLISWRLDSALRAHDWEAFARRYNGPANVAAYAPKLASAFARQSGGGASRVVLRVGSRGRSVEIAQARLEALGYFRDQRGGGVDGVFGSETKAAVERFQMDSKLAVDGVIGARTWAALEAAKPKPADAANDEPPAMKEPEHAKRADEAMLDKLAEKAGGLVVGGVGGRFLEGLGDTAEIILTGGLVVGGLALLAAWALPRIRKTERLA